MKRHIEELPGGQLFFVWVLEAGGRILLPTSGSLQDPAGCCGAWVFCPGDGDLDRAATKWQQTFQVNTRFARKRDLPWALQP